MKLLNRGGVGSALLMLTFCSWCGFALPTYLKSIQSHLYGKGLFEERDVVRVAKVYHDAAHVEWCYALNSELAFASGILIPPDLTVVSIKRMLVTGLNSSEILSKVKASNLSLLILRKDNELKRNEWLSWVTNYYEYTVQGAFTELWIRKDKRIPHEKGSVKSQEDLRIRYVYF